jgi:hypothetical protein
MIYIFSPPPPYNVTCELLPNVKYGSRYSAAPQWFEVGQPYYKGDISSRKMIVWKMLF